MSELLAVMFAIMVGLMSLPTYLRYQYQSNDNVRAAAVAQQAVQLNNAVATYIQQNATATQTSATTPVLLTSATATTAVSLSVQNLQAAGLLPASFNNTNSYGQSWKASVLQPASGNFSALVVTTGATQSDVSLAKIASMIGYNGGFIPNGNAMFNNDSNLTAHGNGWTEAATNYAGASKGHIACLITFNSNQYGDNRLYRHAVPGQTQLNTLYTPLLMDSTGTVQTENAACSTTGAIARNSAGAVLSCINNVWSLNSSWKSPVANKAALPGSGNSVGDVRITTDTNTPYTWLNSSVGWQAFLSGNTYSHLALGYQTGEAENKNIFLGEYSGRSRISGLTNADANVFIGYYSGEAHTAGSWNIYLGPYSGLNASNNQSSIFIGREAGFNSKYSTGNIFMGYEAGYNSVNGNNIFTGFQAGYSNNTGAYNSFSGYQAGYNNTSGSNNIFIGNAAGLQNTSGNHNVFIGAAAGSSNNNINHASAIGADASVTQSNTVQIGAYSVDDVSTGKDLYVGRNPNNNTNEGDIYANNINAANTVMANGITLTSDRRLKTNIQNSQRGLDFIERLRPVDYTLISNQRAATGFIAQEVEAIDPTFPGIYPPSSDKNYYRLSYSDFIPALVKSIQSLSQQLFWLQILTLVLFVLVAGLTATTAYLLVLRCRSASRL